MNAAAAPDKHTDKQKTTQAEDKKKTVKLKFQHGSMPAELTFMRWAVVKPWGWASSLDVSSQTGALV
jgi:hypothetical protein